MRWIDLFRELLCSHAELRRRNDQKFAEIWDYIQAQSDANTSAFERLESRMTSVEQQTWDELGRLVGVVVAEVTSLRDGIAQKDAALQTALAALADADEAAAAQVQAALDADSAADVERVLGLSDRLKAVVPAEVPEVPVPPVGEPAEEPEAPTEPETPAEPTPGDGTEVVNPTPVDEDGNPVPPVA